MFRVWGAVSYSMAGEFRYRNFLPEEPRPGYSAGLTGSILISCIIIPYAGPAFGLVGLIFMLIHLTRINKYNKILEQSGRWEMFYQQRMAALKQQQSTGWQQMQTSFGQSPVPPRNTPLSGDQVKKNPFG